MPKLPFSLAIATAICLPTNLVASRPKNSPKVYCGNNEISTSPWFKFSTIDYSIKQGNHQTKYFAQHFSDGCGLFRRYNESEPTVTTFILIDSSILAFKGLAEGESWFDSFESGNLFLFTTLFGLARISPTGASANKEINGHSLDSKRSLRLSTPGDCHLQLAPPWSISGTTQPNSSSTEFCFTITGKNPNPKLFSQQPNFTYQCTGKWSNVPPQSEIPTSLDLSGFQFAYLGGPVVIKGSVEGKSFKTLLDLRNTVTLALKNSETP